MNSHPWGHESPDAEPVPLGHGEGEALVGERVVDEAAALLAHDLRAEVAPAHHLGADATTGLAGIRELANKCQLVSVTWHIALAV